MSLTYYPINGNAGSISLTLYERVSGDIVDSIGSLSVFEYDEDDEESELNEVFTNINDDLVKNHFGHRKVISFLIANGASLGDSNLAKIFQMVSMLNLINFEPEQYRLAIQYRGSSVYGMMQDAIYFGNFKLNEISNNANAGQTIPIQFKNKTTGTLEYSMDAFLQYMLLEDGSNILLESDTDGTSEIALEAYNVS